MVDVAKRVLLPNAMFLDGDGSDKKVEVSEKELLELRGLKDKFTQFETQTNEQAAELKKVQQENSDYAAMFDSDEALTSLLSKRGKNSSLNQNPSDKQTNVDDYTPSQIITHMTKFYEDNHKKLQDDFDAKVRTLDHQTAIGFARLDVGLTDLRHGGIDKAPAPSFRDLQKEAFALGGDNPTWSAEKCYQEARKNFETSKLVAEKQAKEKTDLERSAFSEKGEIPPSVMSDKTLTGEAATKKAMELVDGKHLLNQGR